MSMNNDVPPEAIIRQQRLEMIRLRQEIDELKSKLELREKAIAEFKKWQSKVAERNYSYWLNEGLKLAHNQPDKEQLNHLKNLLGNFDRYKRYLTYIERAAAQVEKSSILLLKEEELWK